MAETIKLKLATGKEIQRKLKIILKIDLKFYYFLSLFKIFDNIKMMTMTTLKKEQNHHKICEWGQINVGSCTVQNVR